MHRPRWQRFKLSLPCRSKEKGCRSTIDTRQICPRNNGGGRECTQSMDQDLITDSTPDSGYVQPKFGDTVDRCTAFVRGETMGGVFCDSELCCHRARWSQWPRSRETLDASLLLRFNCSALLFFYFLPLSSLIFRSGNILGHFVFLTLSLLLFFSSLVARYLTKDLVYERERTRGRKKEEES